MTTEYLLTVDDVARQCQVSKQSVYKAIDSGLLRARRFGRAVRVSQEDLDQYLNRDAQAQGGAI